MEMKRIYPSLEGEIVRRQNWIGQDLKAMHNTNLRALLTAIWESNPISRADLSKVTGLALSSVTRLLQELDELGLVREIGKGESSGGRLPALIVPNPQAGLVISLDLSGLHLRGGLFDAANNLISVLDQPFDGFGPEATQQQLLNLIHCLVDHPAVQEMPLLGIGISQPGQIDIARGVIRVAYNLRLQDFPLRQILTDEFHLPVYIEHDATVAALAEQYYGAGQGKDDFVYVLVSSGIGSGVVTQGRIYRAQSEFIGEFGHIIVDPGGMSCVCGKRGCLETVASCKAVLMNARWIVEHGQSEILANLCQQDSDCLSVDMVAKAAQQGDTISQDILNRAADYLSLGLNNYACLFGIQRVIIGGELAEIGDVFLDPLRLSLKRNVSPHLEIELIPARLERNNLLRGISMLTLQEILLLQIGNQ